MGIAFCFILGSKLKLTYTPVVIDPDWIANVRLCHKERDLFFFGFVILTNSMLALYFYRQYGGL